MLDRHLKEAAIGPSASKQKVTEALGEIRSDLQAAIEKIEDAYSRVDRLNLPMGWSGSVRPSPWYAAIPGWLLTGMALAMGAPFWFDLLNKACGLRSAGTRPAPARPSQAADEPTPPKPGRSSGRRHRLTPSGCGTGRRVVCC